MPNESILRALPLDDVSLVGDGRTVVMRALTYGLDYFVSDDGSYTYTERWRDGAFRRAINGPGGMVPLLRYEHSRLNQPLGRAPRVWEDGQAVMVEGSIVRTQAGDDLLELLHEELVEGVSIDALVSRSVPIVGGWERQEGRIREVAFTTSAQYRDARVLAVRSSAPGREGTSEDRPLADAVAARAAAVFGT